MADFVASLLSLILFQFFTFMIWWEISCSLKSYPVFPPLLFVYLEGWGGKKKYQGLKFPYNQFDIIASLLNHVIYP